MSLKSDKNDGDSTRRPTYIYDNMIIARSVPLRMRNISDKSCTANQNKHFLSKCCLPECRAIYEIMWKNMIEPDSLQMTV